jgi:hypothetical protein
VALCAHIWRLIIAAPRLIITRLAKKFNGDFRKETNSCNLKITETEWQFIRENGYDFPEDRPDLPWCFGSKSGSAKNAALF